MSQIKTIFRDHNAISSIFGTILLVFLTFLLAGVVGGMAYSSEMSEHIEKSFTKTPMCVIEVEGVVGGVPNDVRYKDNYIRLVHRGGDPLMLDTTFIVITGQGRSYVGTFPYGSNTQGQLVIKYFDLTPSGACPTYKSNNPIIDDNKWSTGEQIVLNGDDSINGTDAATVKVTVAGHTNTSNNYGFEVGSTIHIKVFDTPTQRIIAEDTSVVQLAD